MSDHETDKGQPQVMPDKPEPDEPQAEKPEIGEDQYEVGDENLLAEPHSPSGDPTEG